MGKRKQNVQITKINQSLQSVGQRSLHAVLFSTRQSKSVDSARLVMFAPIEY
jgi:hypothetical protein